MHQFVADQRQRERDGLVSLAARGVHGKPSIVTANTRSASSTAPGGSCAGPWNRARPNASAWTGPSSPPCPPRDGSISRARPPLRRRSRPRTRRGGQPAPGSPTPTTRRPRPAGRLGDHHRHRPPLRRGAQAPSGLPRPLRRPADALARPDQGRQLRPGPIRIPERLHQLLEAPPAQDPGPVRGPEQPAARPPRNAPGWRCSPRNIRNSDGRRPLSYQWFHRGFKPGSTSSTSAAGSPTRPGTRWPPACCGPGRA